MTYDYLRSPKTDPLVLPSSCHSVRSRINTALLFSQRCKTVYKIDYGAVAEKPGNLLRRKLLNL